MNIVHPTWFSGRFRPLLCAPLLAALALLVTGCPHNEYFVRLQPDGDRIARTLTFYCADGTDAKGQPNYRSFDTNELALIGSNYFAGDLLQNGMRYTVHGIFADALPNDIGGNGVYHFMPSSLGDAGVYTERFRGNDDIVARLAERDQAADELTDLLLGWTRKQLRHEHGYTQLHHFIDVEVRHDLKNLAAYAYTGEMVGNRYQTNAAPEFLVRYAQYLYERNYFDANDIPAVFTSFEGADDAALLVPLQKLAARQMGVQPGDPLPPALGIFTNGPALERSFNDYVVGTRFYRDWLKSTQTNDKAKSDLSSQNPEAAVGDLEARLIGLDLWGEPDRLEVRLDLPLAPFQSNGQWDSDSNQVVWHATLEQRGHTNEWPEFCFARWAQPDQTFQSAHFGKILVTDETLFNYDAWHAQLAAGDVKEWDAFLARLQPGDDLLRELNAFRFARETVGSNTNASSSSYVRDLFQNAMKH